MKRTNTIFSVIVLLLLVTILQAQTANFWTKKNDFGGLKRERAVAFSINGTGYAGTGVDTNETTHNDWWAYDPATDLWTQKASLPGSVRRNAVAMVIGNKGYVGTGMDSADAVYGHLLKDFWEYDPAANAWTQKADFPGAGGNGLYFATAFSLDGKGYVCCGKRGSAAYSKEVWEYKPLTDTWLQRADFPGGLRYQLTSFTLIGYAYVGLGTDQNIYRKDIWQYHAGTDTWVQKADFAGGERGSASSFTINERGFICLGADGGLKNDLWEYNPWTDSWTARASYDGSARKEAIAFSTGNRAFVGTGNGYSGKKAGMYEYTPVAITGISENEKPVSFTAYPNPASGQISLDDRTGKNHHYVFLAADGKEAARMNAAGSGTTQVESSNLAPGLYFVLAYDENNRLTGTQKILFR